MKDSFTRGFLAGVIAGIPALTWGLIALSLKWTDIRWAHFASTLIYGRKFITLPEDIFASIAVFFFCGLTGAIFSLIILKISSLNLFFKGWVYGVTIWFIAFVITFLFKVPQLHFIPLHSAISNFIEASIWGLSLGYCLRWFENRAKLRN